jgi:formylglycine-generating enzyme required for sulfatase activity
MAETRTIETKLRVFISYSRKDVAFAQRVVAALEARGLAPVIDTRDLPKLEDWRRELLGFIREADAVVFIVSPNSVSSPVCSWEVEQVAKLNKRLAPIVLERVSDDRIPEAIAKINYLFFDQPNDFEAQAHGLAQALQTDLPWLKEHTRLAELARRWEERQRPSALLLRGQELQDAETWIASRPHGAPESTELHRKFIVQSRHGETRRRNILTSSLVAGLLVALVLAGLAYWQRGIAIDQEGIAKEQRKLAEEQAARSDARAELIQSQLIVRDTPREALRRGSNAAAKLDALGSGDAALPLLSNLLNTARELPPAGSYSHYALGDATVFARQRQPVGSAETVINGRPATKPFTVVGSNDVTGIIDDHGRALGRPFGGDDVGRSYTNDVAWFDDEHFVAATGGWTKMDTGADFTLLNAGLRLYRADGTLVQEILPKNAYPITSVAILEHEDKRIVLAGDGAGNLIMQSPASELSIIPTGVNAPVKRIIVYGWGDRNFNLFLVFGRPDPEQMPVSPESNRLNIEEQQAKIASALGLPIKISYLGDKSSDAIGCAIIVGFELYVCDRNVITVSGFDKSGLNDKPDFSFTAHSEPTTAIALSPSSPVLATASEDGQLRLWWTTGILLAELPANNRERIDALGFIDGGRRLVSSSSDRVRVWDLRDLTEQLKNLAIRAPVERLRDEQWVRFFNPGEGVVAAPELDRLTSLIKDDSRYAAQGRFFVAAQPWGLRVVDTQTSTSRDVLLPVEGDAEKDDSRVNTDVSSGSGTTICVLRYHFVLQGQNKLPGSLYAINGVTGEITAQWTLDRNISGVGVLATHEIAGVTTCWAAFNQSVYIFSPNDGSSRSFTMIDQSAGSIHRLVPVDNTNDFVIAVEPTASSSTVVMFAHAVKQGVGPDGSAAVGTLADADVAGASITASTSISDEVKHIATNSDASRIAVAIQPTYSETVREVRLLDRNLNTLASLPGCPEGFDHLGLSADGYTIRATSSNFIYEQDLRLKSRLEDAKRRLDAWTQEDDSKEIFKQGADEKDWEKGKLILRDGVKRHPTDAQLILLLANREFYTAKTSDEQKMAIELYDKTNSIDPYEPNSHYMRGRAMAVLGDNRKAVEDFSVAIELPHTLPLVKVILGSGMVINTGMYGLSYQVNRLDKANLFLRRALARAILGEWQLVIDDVRWLRDKKLTSTLAYEMEALAFDREGNTSAAIASYEQAVETLKDKKSYGLEEFAEIEKEAGWRGLKLAQYKKRVAELHQAAGHLDEANAAYAAARQLLDDALELPDLKPRTRVSLEQISAQLPKPLTALADQPKPSQQPPRGWLGVNIQLVTDDIADSLNIKPARGALVARVNNRGPAKLAGIGRGDVIVRFDGKEIREMRDLPRIVADTPVGKDVEVVFLRRSEEEKRTVKVGRLDPNQTSDASSDNDNGNAPAQAPMRDWVLGMELANLSEDMRERYRLGLGATGIVVTQVYPASDAATRRIAVGDRIVEVTQQAVSNIGDLETRLDALKRGGAKTALLFVLRGDDNHFIALPLLSSTHCNLIPLIESPHPLSVGEKDCLDPKKVFKECGKCPEMVIVPAGEFTMGSPSDEPMRQEGPQVEVTIAKPFAVGRFAVTFDEWDACVADGGCGGYRPADEGWGRGRRPVINVSWDDAQKYVAWLSRKTGKSYRLPSEAEREYVTRADTTTPFWWGSSITPEQANYDGSHVYNGGSKGEYRKRTMPVDSFAQNPWGLYNVHGNVWEWTADCWDEPNSANPGDERARTSAACSQHVLRGGSWVSPPADLRTAQRNKGYTVSRNFSLGFRVARTLSP